MTKEEFEAANPKKKPEFTDGPQASATWNREIVSNGCAVLPRQAIAAEELCRKNGVPTDFTSNRGRPIFHSRSHRKQVLKIFNLHDNDGGIGD